MRRVALVLVPLLLIAVIAAVGVGRRGQEPTPSDPPPEPFRYDFEYPFMAYRTAPRTDAVADLVRRLDAREAQLELRGSRGVLDSLLEALDIDPASQVLVFSTTSLQTGSIRPSTPRAIYFNDDVYVAWVQGGGPVEIASMDPELGPVFYTLEHASRAKPKIEAERCLRCHDSYSLTGGGVPRFIVGSGYIDRLGNIVSHEGWILTTQRTPLRSRFGGWYVTGRHGDQVHLGNIVLRDVYALQNLEQLRIGNIDSLDGLVDTSSYAAPGSDIVALLVMQHQIDVQNEISRVNYKVRAALHREGAEPSRAVVAELVEPLVEAMLFVGEATLEGPIVGSPEFREQFERRGPTDPAGRSLRELDLEGRLMRYPLSYQIYSKAFDALPAVAKAQAYRRLKAILDGDDASEKFARLSSEDRSAILEILTATKPDFAAFYAAPVDEEAGDTTEAGTDGEPAADDGLSEDAAEAAAAPVPEAEPPPSSP